MPPTRPILRYHGGKWTLANWLISLFPPHRIYVEPFGGAASVLLRKRRAYSEVYNDLDGDVVNLFRVLQDPPAASRLAELLRLTPFSRDEFRLAYQPTTDCVEAARRLVIRAFMGFGSVSANPGHRTGFRANSSRSGTTPAHDWGHYPDCLPVFVERLRGVVVDNRDAIEVMRQHDGPETLHYLDPPYPEETRRQGLTCYRHEMTDREHAVLAQFVRGLAGSVIISGYDGLLYQRLYGDWLMLTRRHWADGARPRVECVWLNPRAQQRYEARLLPLEGTA